MACSKHQLMLHLLLVMELLLQLQKAGMLKALLHLEGRLEDSLSRPGKIK